MATLKTLLGGFAALSLLAGGTLLMTSAGENVAHAQTSSTKATVDSAKARGEIGEQVDGYLGVVDGASPSSSVRNAMAEINIARKSVYSRVADQQNVQVNVVAALTGEKQIKKASSGEFVKDARGSWQRK